MNASRLDRRPRQPVSSFSRNLLLVERAKRNRNGTASHKPQALRESPRISFPLTPRVARINHDRVIRKVSLKRDLNRLVCSLNMYYTLSLSISILTARRNASHAAGLSAVANNSLLENASYSVYVSSTINLQRYPFFSAEK